MTPALLTRMCRGPSRAATKAATDAWSARSSGARQAGVGIGTLYRHFPTREALIEAAYRNELARLCGSAAELLQTRPADIALRTWMDRFIDYLATKHGMADALRAVIASGGNPFAQSRESLLGAIGTLLKAGAADEKLRGDVAPGDVLASLSGVSLVAGSPQQRDQAGRLLDLLLAGLRHYPSAAADAAGVVDLGSQADHRIETGRQ
jgi:AcrR family transcriptional regulator